MFRPSLLAVGTVSSIVYTVLEAITPTSGGSVVALILSVVTLGLHVWNRVMLGKEHRLAEQLAESQKQIEDMKRKGIDRDERLSGLEDQKYKLARELADYKTEQVDKFEDLNYRYLKVSRELAYQQKLLATVSGDSIPVYQADSPAPANAPPLVPPAGSGGPSALPPQHPPNGPR